MVASDNVIGTIRLATEARAVVEAVEEEEEAGEALVAVTIGKTAVSGIATVHMRTNLVVLSVQAVEVVAAATAVVHRTPVTVVLEEVDTIRHPQSFRQRSVCLTVSLWKLYSFCS